MPSLADAPPLSVTTPRLGEVLDRAQAVVEADGVDALTMRRLADDLGIRAPSLYKHVADKAELVVLLQERALVQMGTALRTGRRSARTMARAYRAWALANPGLYELATAIPLDRSRLAAGVEDWAAAPLLDLVAGDEDRARALWAAAHGLTVLELSDRFPPGADLDAAWDLVASSLG